MDTEQLAKIRKRCDDATNNYAGIREHDYARDVAVLLKWIDDLLKTGDKLVVAGDALKVENGRPLQQTDSQSKQLQ